MDPMPSQSSIKEKERSSVSNFNREACMQMLKGSNNTSPLGDRENRAMPQAFVAQYRRSRFILSMNKILNHLPKKRNICQMRITQTHTSMILGFHHLLPRNHALPLWHPILSPNKTTTQLIINSLASGLRNPVRLRRINMNWWEHRFC